MKPDVIAWTVEGFECRLFCDSTSGDMADWTIAVYSEGSLMVFAMDWFSAYPHGPDEWRAMATEIVDGMGYKVERMEVNAYEE